MHSRAHPRAASPNLIEIQNQRHVLTELQKFYLLHRCKELKFYWRVLFAVVSCKQFILARTVGA